MYFFFFFQAEDGIRDTSVTGVQTCALPILTQRGVPPFRPCCAAPTRLSKPNEAGKQRRSPDTIRTESRREIRERSEERRVGKECRARRRTKQIKKKKEEMEDRRECQR